MFNMAEIYSDFMGTLAVIGVLLALGIIFNDQLEALEDRFDAWYANWKQNRK